jgi:ATP-dependent DNA helicase RecQ
MAIAAFTATADPVAQQTIQRVLQLQHPQQFLLNPYRDNLHLAVKIAWTPRGRRKQLLQFIQQQSGQTGLVYVRARADSEELAEWLSEKGYRAAAYHAGLTPQERRQIETAWLNGDLQFVVCTSAFGMGVNKSNVRWVVHFHTPTLLSEYVQEVGRAGRDGKPAEALTLISEPTGWLDPEDQQRLQCFQKKMRSQYRAAQQLVHVLPEQGDVSEVAREFKQGAIALSLLHSVGQLQWQDPFRYSLTSTQIPQFPVEEKGATQMQQFLQTKECRWKFLLNAFGFGKDAEALRCGHCDRCC